MPTPLLALAVFFAALSIIIPIIMLIAYRGCIKERDSLQKLHDSQRSRFLEIRDALGVEPPPFPSYLLRTDEVMEEIERLKGKEKDYDKYKTLICDAIGVTQNFIRVSASLSGFYSTETTDISVVEEIGKLKESIEGRDAIIVDRDQAIHEQSLMINKSKKEAQAAENRLTDYIMKTEYEAESNRMKELLPIGKKIKYNDKTMWIHAVIPGKETNDNHASLSWCPSDRAHGWEASFFEGGAGCKIHISEEIAKANNYFRNNGTHQL